MTVGNLPAITPPPLRDGRLRDRSDDELVAAARGGERDALDLLLRRHYDRIAVLCRRMCSNEADAADATQEALITIARRLDRFDGRSSFSTWAYRVATNACLDELRRRRRRPEPLDPSGAEHSRDTVIEDTTDPVVDRAEVVAALAAVPAEFRAAVVLRDVLDLEYAQIAEVLDVPVGTVRSRIARGRSHLARAVTGNRTAPPDRPTRTAASSTPPSPAGPSPAGSSVADPSVASALPTEPSPS